MSLERAPFIIRVGKNDSTAQLRTGIMSSCMLDGQAPQKGTHKFFMQHLRLQKKATDTDTVPSILINFNHVGNFRNPDITWYHMISHRCFLHLSPHPPRSGSKVPQNFGLCHGSEPVHSTELAMTLLRAWDLWVLPSSVGVSKWRSYDELPLISGIFTGKAMITISWFWDSLFLKIQNLK